MTVYVLGFAFWNNQVCLIRKNRPKWQENHFNGVGGHVEVSDESSRAAMAREFFEETGVKTLASEWLYTGKMVGDDWTVHLYAGNINIDNATTMTDEEVLVVDLNQLMDYVLIPNVHTLISWSLARLDGADGLMKLYY
ncbi:probable NUDIX hydrolase [Xanthomonas phage Xp15]|uniref:Probable NUDIX hydrolase n=1 Tax=Xanthomonas phage Xp15 TaxID=322855 RepID=Q52PR3_9CAUD|nr:probable NUDIX hydrolase [Xanthomonas phage Xp15]AAX84895.1 probable NUDIX hydrolase [Xanthomonas phage Xp15]